jgi:hypothetical protein
MKKRNKGQTLMEFSILLLLFFSTFSLALAQYFHLLVKSYTLLDSYYLQRAHLYGNQLDHCKPSTLLPNQNYFHIRYHCEGDEKLNIEFLFQDHLIDKKLLKFRRP